MDWASPLKGQLTSFPKYLFFLAKKKGELNILYLREFLELGAQILGGVRSHSNSFISGVFCDRGHLGRGTHNPILEK